tara:strand:- start:3692 stop:3934 length:243 start_codon:yes stop_codon:yes gene_type:complete
VLTNEEDKKRVKAIFNGWLELVEGREAINKDIGELKKEAADIFSVKAAIVSKLFNHLRKLYNGDEDELEELRELVEDIRE